MNSSFDLGNDFLLLAFENAFFGAKYLFGEKEINDEEILFNGDLLNLLEAAERFAVKMDNGEYKDYYYNSEGFPVAARSIQSAIWVIEDERGTPNKFNYFIILKKSAVSELT